MDGRTHMVGTLAGGLAGRHVVVTGGTGVLGTAVVEVTDADA